MLAHSTRSPDRIWPMILIELEQTRMEKSQPGSVRKLRIAAGKRHGIDRKRARYEI
jgi:hypothetical protein